MKVVVPFAEGFEELEAITIVDILRRAEVNVTTVFFDRNPVIGSHNISVFTDKKLSDLTPNDFNCIVLPGGLPGSENLKKSDIVISFIKQIFLKGGYVAAICAAPMVLGSAGVLHGKNATCYPGFEDHLIGANPKSDPVIVDDNVITGKGPGCVIPFSLELVGVLKGKEVMINLKDKMQVYWM